MSLKDFEIGKELGKGAFGTVSIVKRIEDKKTYAMKRVKINQLGAKEKDNALNEVRILASLSHTNIIGYKEAFFDEDSKTLNIVMEFADDGDLDSKIQKHAKMRTNFQESDLWSYLAQTLSGLKYLHDSKIMHRDLKCANIFLLKNGTLKLGDLNVSKIVKMGLATTQTGTPYYASPEVWADKPYNYKSDIWSVACVLYELCQLKPPFRGANLEQLYKNIQKGVYEPISSIYSKDLSSILSQMLQVNPANRPSCDQLLNNPILIKKISDIVDGKEDVNEPQPMQLLKTIKMPRNMNEINRALPKKKRYKEEMEMESLMDCDVNTNKKVVAPLIELGKKENEDREILLKKNINHKDNNRDNRDHHKDNRDHHKDNREHHKDNKEVNYIMNNLNQDLRSKEKDKIYVANVNNNNNNNYNYNQILQQKNPIQMNRNVVNNNNNNIISPSKRDNNPIQIRPSSAKNENRQINMINQQRTPILNKNENINNLINKNNLNKNNQIYISNNNGNNGKINYHNQPNNNRVINNVPSQKNNILIKDPVRIIKDDRSKQIVQVNNNNNVNRPVSAKIGGNNNNNNLIQAKNEVLNKIHQMNNQIIRKNISNDRPQSAGRNIQNQNPLLKRPQSNNSPRNKSPIRDNKINIYNNNVINRPQSGKDRINVNNVNLNNNLIQRNDKKVLIERIPYDKNLLLKQQDPKKNYNYNQNYRDNLINNNKNNMMNAIKVNDRPISRGEMNNQNGPKIVYINQRK